MDGLDNLVELDEFQSLETLFKRDYNSTRFIACTYVGNGLSINISDDLTDIELVYIIQSLNDYRNRIMLSDA